MIKTAWRCVPQFHYHWPTGRKLGHAPEGDLGSLAPSLFLILCCHEANSFLCHTLPPWQYYRHKGNGDEQSCTETSKPGAIRIFHITWETKAFCHGYENLHNTGSNFIMYVDIRFPDTTFFRVLRNESRVLTQSYTLTFIYHFETGLLSCPNWAQTCNAPASASHSARIIRVCHLAHLQAPFTEAITFSSLWSFWCFCQKWIDSYFKNLYPVPLVYVYFYVSTILFYYGFVTWF